VGWIELVQSQFQQEIFLFIPHSLFSVLHFIHEEANVSTEILHR